jgi:undecaprenyl-diphosphatase
MDILKILILAIVQGAAELLPVSSSAHVIVAEKAMGLDPTTPQMTLLLVMLHTGTMFAVIVYFWRSWMDAFFRATVQRRENLVALVVATGATGVVGLTLQALIKHIAAGGDPNFEIEQIFGNPILMAISLAAAGVLIIISSRLKEKASATLSWVPAMIIGAVQGLCLPFRGFSRSGATISAALVIGLSRRRAEEFSFALAVILTPVVILKEVLRLFKHQGSVVGDVSHGLLQMLAPGLLGMALSFLAGLAALRWLSSWLERGRWYLFGGYCLIASLVVLWVG